MRDLDFYNVGCDRPRGPRFIMVVARRLLRRILRPIFQRQVQLFTSLRDRLDAAEGADNIARAEFVALKAEIGELSARQDRAAEQLGSTLAFGWDYVAMVRRLAALEDRVEELSAGRPSVPPRPMGLDQRRRAFDSSRTATRD